MNDEYQTRQFWDRSLNLQTEKLVNKAHDLVNNKRLGTCVAIEEHIQDVGDYELVLTLRLK